MKLTNIAIKRRVFTTMIYLSIMIVGFTSLGKLSLDFFPDITFPTVMIMTQHPGVGPEEIESSITKKIEGAVASVEGIDKLTATSKEGVSIVSVQFKWGQNLDAAVADLRDKLDLIRDDIPDDATKPTIFRISMANIPVMMLGIMGNRPNHELYDLADQKLQDQIEQVKGVASMNIEGGRKRQVHIKLRRNRLDAYGFTPSQIINVLRQENKNVSGGDIKSGYTKYSIRTQGEFKNLKEIRNVVIAYRNGIPIYLKYVADVKWGVSEKIAVAKFDSILGLRLIIRKQSGANTVAVVKRLKKKLAEIQRKLPKGVKLYEVFNTADFVQQSISGVASSGILGGLLAVIIVLFFLRNIRASIIIGLSIPISIIATFIAMYFSNVTLNIVSMGGLALGIGMLVDNAIVVLENTFSYLNKGQKPAEAARLGAQEIAMAIFSSTLTTVCVFLPIVFTQGIAKEIFMEMALTVAFSLLASLFVSLTLVPMLSSKFLRTTDDTKLKKKSARLHHLATTGERLLNYLDNKYKYGLEWVLHHRKLLLFFVLLLFIFTFGIVGRFVDSEFMPESDEGNIKITIEMPAGTRLRTTTKAIAQMEKIIRKNVLAKDRKVMFFIAGDPGGFGAIFGTSGSHLATYRLKLHPKTERSVSTIEYVKKLKPLFEKAPAPLGIAKFRFTTQGGGALMGSQFPIDILVRGYDLKKGANLAKQIKKVMQKIPGLYNINISRQEGLPEMVVRVNRVKAAALGLGMGDITKAVQNSMLGKIATFLKKDGKEIDIFVRLREKDRQKKADIENIQVISSSTRKAVRLGNIAKIVKDIGPIDIERDNQERVIHVTCSTFAGLKSSVETIKKAIKKDIVTPAGFTLDYQGSYKDMQDSFGDLFIAFFVAAFLVYAVMASIFESFLDPLIIIITIPLSIIGVIWMLALTGTSLNINSAIGILVLAGIVVNNGIVLVDYINILRGRGYKLHEAIIEGGRRRLRPILMTTLTTILAMVPLAIGIGEGSESTEPLARAVIGGLTFSTLLSLFVIPVIYSAFESFILHFKAIKSTLKEIIAQQGNKLLKYTSKYTALLLAGALPFIAIQAGTSKILKAMLSQKGAAPTKMQFMLLASAPFLIGALLLIVIAYFTWLKYGYSHGIKNSMQSKKLPNTILKISQGVRGKLSKIAIYKYGLILLTAFSGFLLSTILTILIPKPAAAPLIKIATTLGTLIGVPLAIIFSYRYALVSTCFLHNNRLTTKECFTMSRQLMKGNWITYHISHFLLFLPCYGLLILAALLAILISKPLAMLAALGAIYVFIVRVIPAYTAIDIVTYETAKKRRWR